MFIHIQCEITNKQRHRHHSQIEKEKHWCKNGIYLICFLTVHSNHFNRQYMYIYIFIYVDIGIRIHPMNCFMKEYGCKIRSETETLSSFLFVCILCLRMCVCVYFSVYSAIVIFFHIFHSLLFHMQTFGANGEKQKRKEYSSHQHNDWSMPSSRINLAETYVLPLDSWQFKLIHYVVSEISSASFVWLNEK